MDALALENAALNQGHTDGSNLFNEALGDGV